jgi:DNA mismatch repair protein MutS
MAPATPTSILFEQPEAAGVPSSAPPGYFDDLNLDLVVAAIMEGHSGLGLEGLLWTPLDSRDDVQFRQEVFQDLDGTLMLTRLMEFTDAMGTVRGRLARSRRAQHACEQQRRHLDAAVAYCNAVLALNEAVRAYGPRSRGLRRLGAYLLTYAGSESFRDLATSARGTSAALADVTYCVSIDGGKVQVGPFRGELAYGSEVDKTLARFAPPAAGDLDKPATGQGGEDGTDHDDDGIDHVEARILELVAKHFPTAFSRLALFSREHPDFLDANLVGLDREAHFYLAILMHFRRLKSASLRFCYPEVVDRGDRLCVSDGFDLALAGHLVERGRPVVSNNFQCVPGERVFVVTGPNHGGKTTFARMVGQVHHLAALGGPVPGTAAKVPLCDLIFTHFARQELLSDRRGALEDDLVRAHTSLRSATARSVLIFNEIFTSTTSDDAALLGARIVEEVLQLGALCVYVTFVDELASLGQGVVSMVATVDRDDPSARTYKVVRQPADGRAYAATLAEKYGLSYECLKDRVAP